MGQDLFIKLFTKFNLDQSAITHKRINQSNSNKREGNWKEMGMRKMVRAKRWNSKQSRPSVHLLQGHWT